MKEEYRAYLHKLLENENIFVCGPQFDDNENVRVYAYGGLLCKMPVVATNSIIFPNINYIKYAKDDTAKLEKSFDVSLVSSKKTTEGKTTVVYNYKWNIKCPDDKRKFELLQGDNLNMLLNAMKNKFKTESNGAKERTVQTLISRNHMDLSNSAAVICDFESSIPNKQLDANNSGSAKFDLVALDFIDNDPKRPRLTIVELKCNKSACTNESGLKKHSIDMRACLSKKEYYINEICRRLDVLISADPCIIKGLPHEFTEKLHSSNPSAGIELRAGFLFTAGEGLSTKAGSVKLCKEYIDGSPDSFVYQFADTPEDVDLGKMETWQQFCI